MEFSPLKVPFLSSHQNQPTSSLHSPLFIKDIDKIRIAKYIGDAKNNDLRSTDNKKGAKQMKKSFGAKTLIFPTPVWCVGSYDAKGNPNVMTIAWGGICCSKPPCVTISLRKATYTYGNIMEKQAYTLSVPSVRYVREADYFGMASGRNVNKFKETGLTPVRSELVDAPYVGEFPMVLECKVIHHYEIGLHTHFVGEILDVKADDDMSDDDGNPDIEKICPIVFSPEIQKYHAIGAFIGKAFEIGKKR
jgi:flavin reductase (DIM6/NTAB) family NADH-FMN oxidoreductase RutF